MTAITDGTPRRALGWFVVLVAGTGALHVAGRGLLAPPPLGSIDALSTWAAESGPVTMAVALVRLAAEIGGVYLLAITVLQFLGHVLRITAATTLADALSTPATRRLVRGGLGIGLVTAGAISGAAAEPTVAPSGAVMTVLDPSPSDDVAAAEAGQATMTPVPGATASMVPIRTGPSEDSQDTATMTPMPPTGSPEPTPPEPTPPGSAPSATPAITVATPVAAPRPVAAPTTWSVERGESLWSIAAEIVGAGSTTAPEVASVDAYWRRLIETNRSRLVDPDNPDLILPGQVLELPGLTSS